MKKLLFFWSLLAIAIGFTACNNDDLKFEFDEEGTCFLPNVSPISHATFLKYAEGNGWKHVSTYEINEDGSVQNHDHYKDLIGGGPSSYYFEKDTYTSYYWLSAYPADAYSEVVYTYSENGNRIGHINRFNDNFFTKFQILSINENKLQMIEHIGIRSNRNIYALTTYKKMSKEELNNYRENFVNREDLKHNASFAFNSLQEFTTEMFQDEIAGFGWQWNYTYEIDSDEQTYTEKSYYTNQDEATHYYFENDSLIRFFQTENGVFAHSKEPYTLLFDTPPYRLVNEATNDTIYLLSAYSMLDVREKLGIKDEKPVWGLSTYIKMSEDKLKQFMEKYATRITNP